MLGNEDKKTVQMLVVLKYKTVSQLGVIYMMIEKIKQQQTHNLLGRKKYEAKREVIGYLHTSDLGDGRATWMLAGTLTPVMEVMDP